MSRTRTVRFVHKQCMLGKLQHGVERESGVVKMQRCALVLAASEVIYSLDFRKFDR